MKDTDKTVALGPTVSRRQVIGTAAAAGALSALPWGGLEAEVARMKEEGWVGNPVACNMCGGGCGLLVMRKPGTPVSKETVRIVPNPTHPQRGYCARGASAMWVWNHPLRLKKPMKRVGERGEGKLVECSWDEALDGIAAKLKEIVAKYGENAVTMSSHDFTAMQKWFASALGTVNVITHSSTCNAGSNMGRRLVFGHGFEGGGKVEPDYENCRFLLLNGRTLNCAIGIAGVVGRARQRGARVTFVDPRMPEGALSGSDWIPIHPGTDSALHLGLMHIAIKEKLFKEEFVTKHSNAPYLVTDAGQPVTEAMLKEGGSKRRFVVMDRTSGGFVFVGPKLDAKGTPVGFDEPADLMADLYFEGSIEDKNGQRVGVKTAFKALEANVAQYTPTKVAKITHIPSERVIQLARDFFTLGGVADDGWFSARNGDDSHTFQAQNMLNVLNGNLDQKGGLVITGGAGFKGPGVSLAKGKGKGPQGQTWTVDSPEKAPMDKKKYPESFGTFSAAYEAIETGKPYPIRAAFFTGTTMFHREANTESLKRALKALDLIVVQEILPHEICDWADYVLPSTYFMETYGYANVKWSLNGDVHRINPALQPPEGNEARNEIWQFCEILRRAYPERAAERLGYAKEMKSADEFNAWYNGMVDGAWDKYIAKLNAAKPGKGDRVAKEVAEHGWSKVNDKVYGVYPYKKPFGTLTGKPEIFCFYMAQKYEGKYDPMPRWVEAPAYTQPKPQTDEFVLVSGKDGSGSSGTALFTKPQQFLGDRTVWMNPADAKRLGIEHGDMIELESLDTGLKGQNRVKLTNRIIQGSIFHFGFQGGVRTKGKFVAPGYEWVREGINSHNFATGIREPVIGVKSNNCAVRVKRV